MVHLQREIDRLKRKMLALGALVEESMRLAMQGLEEHDVEKAHRVINTDAVIDEQEVDVEEECLKILALYQPVAKDLRFLIAVVKINSELERIGDLSAEIAEKAIECVAGSAVAVPSEMITLADRTERIVERALDSLVRQDARTARRVLAADDEIDAFYASLIEELKNRIRADLDDLDGLILLVNVARCLERMADHATNIAEDVLYMVEGEIYRHQTPGFYPVALTSS